MQPRKAGDRMKLRKLQVLGGAVPLPPARWLAVRAALEDEHLRRRKRGKFGLRGRRWEIAAWTLRWGLKLSGLYRRGARNARDVRYNCFDLIFDDLPAGFDGYRVLHLSDLHFDRTHNPVDHYLPLVAGIKADLCVLTGDYRYRRHGPIDDAVEAMAALVGEIATRDGIFATLGNHDTARMVQPFAELGIRVLGNETLSLSRAGDYIHLTGLDDVHHFYTRDADRAIAAAPDGFRIALVHSPEFAVPAANAGVSLYLSGHTHGGQLCLPGARPVITNQYGNRRYAVGLWECGAMLGFTSAGAGASVVPVRFNCRGEITMITLRRSDRPSFPVIAETGSPRTRPLAPHR